MENIKYWFYLVSFVVLFSLMTTPLIINENKPDLNASNLTYKVKKGDTYKSLAAISSININAEDQLRLINGDYPDKKLEIGRVIKIVN